ncbi:protein kinase [Nocardia cyriacigeorgica]|nr:serine/threonine-protein kinase [Nocardia cyriacigeorgica]MBF6102222.1 protein kinase [Nocardia cyriacigeorgica]MBF6317515.1 protein kinase [Nocardia cyriacigeorgica]MBF6533293.1 protein kinase [Nocardia cyriacigeorgica]TLF53969.1 serine/threonine protein kinase [Nocardia cyriacigeorgica]
MQPGSVFAGYQIERRLGRGGMGSVYLAKHPRLPRRTALKLLNPDLFDDKETRARFEREADLAAQLDHPNIVTVYDRGAEDGQLWISMQYIDGVDAASLDPNTLPVLRAVQIIADTAQALDFAHSMGVLHRDVKPANILLSTAHTGPERVYLTDFGIARLRDDGGHLTQTGSFTATIAYASPEQLTGAPLDHRTDQYSLACSLYWLLTGTAPFSAPHPVAVIQGHLQHQPPALSSVRHGLPIALDAVLARGLAKRPGERYGSCAEFADAVRAALSGAVHPSLPRAQVAGAYPSGPHAYPSGPHPHPQGFDQSASGPYVRAAGTMQAPMATGHGQPIVAQALPVGAAAGQLGGARTPPRSQPLSQAPVSAATGAARSMDAGVVRSRKRWVIGVSAAAVVVVVAALTGVIVSNIPADDEPTAIQAISEEFPNMVPDNDLGLGFNGHTCMSQDPSRGRELWKGQTSDGPDSGQWAGAWHCYDGRTDYYLLKYDHEQDLHQVLDAMKPIDITSDVNGSVIYENYHLAGKDPKEHAMVSGFPIPDRAQYLLYTTGKFKTPEEFMDWWKSLPLS